MASIALLLDNSRKPIIHFETMKHKEQIGRWSQTRNAWQGSGKGVGANTLHIYMTRHFTETLIMTCYLLKCACMDKTSRLITLNQGEPLD